MELQGKTLLDATLAKLPPYHEMRDLVEELLAATWEPENTSSSSSDSLSPRAPLVDLSSELYDFSVEETDTSLLEASKCGKADSVQQAMELKETERHGIFTKETLQKACVSFCCETDEDVGTARKENFQKTLVIEDLEANAFNWPIKDDNSETGADNYGFEAEECNERSQKDSEKAVVIIKADDSECEGLNEECDVGQAVIFLGSDTEVCKAAVQKDNKTRRVTFSETQKKGHERMPEGKNEEFLSRTETESTLSEVTVQTAEDNVMDIEYPTSVSSMRGPHRRTMAAEDGGASLLCVGTHRFFHMQPETEQVVWGSRQPPDREPNIIASGMYRTVDISGSEGCVSVSDDINMGHNGTNFDDSNENTSAVNTGTPSGDQELYITPSLSLSALQTNTDSEYQIVSGGNGSGDGNSVITIGLSAQPAVGVGEVKVEIQIVVGNRAVSPNKESPYVETISVGSQSTGIEDEACSGASGRDKLDITKNSFATEGVCFGEEMVGGGGDAFIRTCSAVKCVQTDSCAYYDELISEDNGALRTIHPVSVEKFVQTDFLSILQHEQSIITRVYHTESSDSARNIYTTEAHTTGEDTDKAAVSSALSFTEIGDTVRVAEQDRSISDNEYSDRGQEMAGIINSPVSDESESNKLSVSNLPPGEGWLGSPDESSVTQPDAVCASAVGADVMEQFSGGRLDHTESMSVRSRMISAEGEEHKTVSVDEEGRLLREGLACALQVLTYRDQLFPPLCLSCLLPQSAASIRQGGARVHDSGQVERQSYSDHVTVLEHGEHTLLGDQDSDLGQEGTLVRLPSVEDYTGGALSTYQSTVKVEERDNVSTALHLKGVRNSEITGNITSLLYQSQHGDYHVANNSDVTKDQTSDVSARKPPDPTSGGDNVKMSLECLYVDKMGNLYSTEESQDVEMCQGHADTGGRKAEAVDAGARCVALNVTSDDAIITEGTRDVDVKSVNVYFTSDCAAIHTNLINMDVKSDGNILNSDGATTHTNAMDADNLNVMLRVRRDRTNTGDCQLTSTNYDEIDRLSERAYSEHKNALNVAYDAESSKKTCGVDNRNAELRLTGDCAVTRVIPATIEQLIGATHSSSSSNTSFAFTEDKADAVNEASEVATTTRDNIRLDIDRCEASFQRHHVPDKLDALRGRVINHSTPPVGNDLSKREDMGHQGAVEVQSSNKETQTALNMSTITTTEATRKTEDKETQTKAVAYGSGDDKEEAKPTGQAQRTEEQGGLETSTTEEATETKHRTEEKIKVAEIESHPYTAPSTPASPLSTGDKRRTSSGDTGSEAARDGTNCAATGSSEQEAPERGRAIENSSSVPRDQAPVHRASDAAVPRDTLSAVGNRCGDAMRQKNKANDNDPTPADVKAVIIANGGTTAEAASGAANDCNGHVNNHHHHHSTARSILKSVLKRTGSGGHHKKNPGGKATAVPAPPPPPQQQPPPTQNQPVPKKKHRVQFDESKNKFFDADYVILIREEEGEEEEEEDEEGEEEEELEDEEEVCTCGASVEMGRLRPPIVGAVRAPPPAGCRRPMQPPGGAVQVLPRTPGTC